MRLEESVEESSPESDVSSTENDELPSPPAYNDFIAGLNRQLTSSPIIFLNEIAEDEAHSTMTTTVDTTDSVENPLSQGSSLSVEYFSNEFLSIKCKYGISDVGAAAMLKLFRSALPYPNACPTLNQLNRSSGAAERYIEIKDGDGSYFELDVRWQLEKIINDNENIFDSFEDNISDMLFSKAFARCEEEGIKYIYLLVNSDGVASAFQSKRYQIWPIVASILNLHPRQRRKFHNLLVCMLYYGKAKVDMIKYLQMFVKQINGMTFEHNDLTVKVRVVTLIADTPAKAACLNITSFNGYFGCPNCSLRGFFDTDMHKMLYPLDEEAPLRNESTYALNLAEAEKTGKPFRGVKGPSPLAYIMRLPIVPFDQMHLLYLGIVRSIVSHVLSHNLIKKEALERTLDTVKVPSSFTRKPRSLSYIPKYKATEWKHLILYFHCAFYDTTQQRVKIILSTLSTVIHLLNGRYVFESDCDNATDLIKMFHENCLQLFGRGTQSFSMHALSHLPHQVKQFGALWASSAATFESSFHQLKRTLTGTRNEAGLLVKRFVLNKEYNSTLFKTHCSNLGNGVQTLGTCKRISSRELSDLKDSYNVSLSDSEREIFRFSNNGVIFHSFAYAKKGMSASFRAVLCSGSFVSIDRIIITGNNFVMCLCTELRKLRSVIDEIVVEDDEDDRRFELLRQCCPTFVVEHGAKYVIPATSFLSHLIVVYTDCYSFATPVLCDFEHD